MLAWIMVGLPIDGCSNKTICCHALVKFDAATNITVFLCLSGKLAQFCSTILKFLARSFRRSIFKTVCHSILFPITGCFGGELLFWKSCTFWARRTPCVMFDAYCVHHLVKKLTHKFLWNTNGWLQNHGILLLGMLLTNKSCCSTSSQASPLPLGGLLPLQQRSMP